MVHPALSAGLPASALALYLGAAIAGPGHAIPTFGAWLVVGFFRFKDCMRCSS